jgi:hypothetical protein
MSFGRVVQLIYGVLVAVRRVKGGWTGRIGTLEGTAAPQIGKHQLVLKYIVGRKLYSWT